MCSSADLIIILFIVIENNGSVSKINDCSRISFFFLRRLTFRVSCFLLLFVGFHENRLPFQSLTWDFLPRECGRIKLKIGVYRIPNHKERASFVVEYGNNASWRLLILIRAPSTSPENALLKTNITKLVYKKKITKAIKAWPHLLRPVTNSS